MTLCKVQCNQYVTPAGLPPPSSSSYHYHYHCSISSLQTLPNTGVTLSVPLHISPLQSSVLFLRFSFINMALAGSLSGKLALISLELKIHDNDQPAKRFEGKKKSCTCLTWPWLRLVTTHAWSDFLTSVCRCVTDDKGTCCTHWRFVSLHSQILSCNQHRNRAPNHHSSPAQSSPPVHS